MSLRMPAIWSSSERPISVRTVWVDGVRHAILSADDPIVNKKLQIQNHKESERELVLENTKKNEKRRRARPATSMNTRRIIVNSYSSRSSCDNSEKNFYHEEGGEVENEEGNNYYENDLRECLVKLRLVVKNNEKTVECSSSSSSSSNFSSPRTLSNRENNFGSCHGLLFPKTNQTRIYDPPYNLKSQKSFGFSKSPCHFNYCEKIRKIQRDELSIGSNTEPSSKLPEIQNNSLSERVLQWLDISGRVKNYDINKNDDHNSRIFGGNFFHRKKITPLFLGTDTNRNHDNLSRRRSNSALVRNNINNNINNNNHNHKNHKREERMITQQYYTLNTTTATTTTTTTTRTTMMTTDFNSEEKEKDLNHSREKVKTREGGDKNCTGRHGSFLNNYNNDNNQQHDNNSGSFGIRSCFPIDGTVEINNDTRLKIFHNEKEEAVDCEEERLNVWSPPRKPQLHIFMPSLTAHNLNSNSDKIMSSLESVRD